MKKIVTMMIVVAFGLVSNAAQIQWGAFFGSYEDAKGDAFTGGTALLCVLSGDASTAVNNSANAWNLNGAQLVATSGYNAEFGGWGSLNWVDGGSSVVAGTTEGATQQYFSLIIVDKAGVAKIDDYAGNYTVMTAQGSQEVVDPSGPTYGVNVVQFDNIESGSWQTATVPEPTSGLLLLLGMAGLALRRKQA